MAAQTEGTKYLAKIRRKNRREEKQKGKWDAGRVYIERAPPNSPKKRKERERCEGGDDTWRRRRRELQGLLRRHLGNNKPSLYLVSTLDSSFLSISRHQKIRRRKSNPALQHLEACLYLGFIGEN